jgi:hypothetical protein
MKDNKKPKPINIDHIDLDHMKKKTTDIPGLLEYAHSVGGFSVVPTKDGAIKGHSLKVMEQQTQMQMDQIYDQMKLLASQAKHLQTRADVSLEIYNAEMRFKPVVGETYYLYEKENAIKTLSPVSPKEWGDKIPFKSFISKVRLLADHTWDILKED